MFKDVSYYGVYYSGEVVGLGNFVCEKCYYYLVFYIFEVLLVCLKCGYD